MASRKAVPYGQRRPLSRPLPFASHGGRHLISAEIEEQGLMVWIQSRRKNQSNKALRKSRRKRLARRKNQFQPNFESLEARLMLAADPFYSAAAATEGVDLRLLIEDVDEVSMLRLLDGSDQELAASPLSDVNGSVRVVGSGFDDTFQLDIGTPTVVALLADGIQFEGGDGDDRLVGPNASTTWNITAANGGNLDQSAVVEFTDIENLTGNGASDTFVFGASGELTDTIDGGDGVNTLDYSAYSDSIIVDLLVGEAALFTSVSGFQHVFGTAADDILLGDGSATARRTICAARVATTPSAAAAAPRTSARQARRSASPCSCTSSTPR
ncbi:MAG: LEPR-XLL domain-containing protein [Pirellulales bacterium]